MLIIERMAQAEIQPGKPVEKPAATGGTLTLMEKPKEEIKPPGTGGKSRILVIDDSEVVRNLFRDFLVAEGYDVTLASDGRKGLDAFKQDPKAILAW